VNENRAKGENHVHRNSDRKLELLPPELQREVVDFVEAIERFVEEMESEI